MNKLVSRNPVLRFKLGRKIVKGADGLKANLYGEQAYFLDKDNKVYIGHVDHLGASNSKRLTQRYVWNNRNYGSFDGGKTYYDLASLKPLSSESNLALLSAIERGKQKKLAKEGPSVSRNTERPYYLKGFQSRMNQDLKSRGDVKAFQKKLIGLYGVNAVGKYGADGIWGADTQAAYDRYLADLKRKQLADNLQLQTIKIVPQETPTLIASTIPQVNNNIRTGNYNRSLIRDLIRSLGYDPYSFSGSERKALRRYLNGESNDTSKLVGNLAQFIEGYKKGGLIRKGQKGLPTAPKAEDRYSNSYISWNWPNYKEVTANSKLFPGGAKISLTIEGIDTIYTETPPRFPFVKVIPRTAKNNAKTILWRDLITGQTYPEVKRGNSLEYETLKRRFNTAWNLAKNKY